MNATLVEKKLKKNGVPVRLLRMAAGLSPAKLAELAEVPLEHVTGFERGYPVPLDSRRRLLRILWAGKNRE